MLFFLLSFLPLLYADFDCTFNDTYPKQYIAYRTTDTIILDGKLDDPMWTEVPFTDNFVDINTTIIPYLTTKAKIRWNDTFLFIGAMVEEPRIWANITYTCHCLDPDEDQVIFHDNDFEVFVDADGSTHYYKEYEMNAANATWDLCLNKPYNDGGYENSTRVYGTSGFDMQPPLTCAVYVDGELNNPNANNNYWSLEIAFPLAGLALNKSVDLPPKNGTFWRINFSRVEWNVDIVDGAYIKDPSCQSCPDPGSPHEDNWVWTPQGEVDMHLPERWGMLQMSTEKPGTTQLVRNNEWTVRSVAMVLYYAEHSYQQTYGKFTNDINQLQLFADPPVLNGTCTMIPDIKLTENGDGFYASIGDNIGSMTALIQDDRLLTVEHYQ